jgi:hypothetical protein
MVDNTTMLLLASILSTSAAVPTFPNIGYLGRGYNLLYGNPLPTSLPVDPGFKNSVFSMTGPGTDGPDGYNIPEGTEVVQCETCTLNFRGSEFTGTHKYQSSLESSVTVEAGYMGASFSASTDYKSVSESTSTNNRTFVQTDAVCSMYCAQVMMYTPPNLTNNFLTGLATLQRTLDPTDMAAYYTFIGQFGTHVITGLIMGSRYGQLYEFTSESYSSLLSSNLKVEASAGYAGLFSAKVTTLTETQQSEAQSFLSLTYDQHTFSAGSRIPTNGDVGTWIETSSNNPMPIKYTLTSLDDVIRNYAPVGENAQVADNMEQVLAGYCDYLLSQNKVDSCAPPPPDPNFPLPAKICVRQSASYGGVNAGNVFDTRGPSNFESTITRVSKVLLRSGKRLDSLQLILDNGQGSFAHTDSEGGTGGSITELDVRAGLQISGVNLWTGTAVDAIQFLYSDGSVSAKYGGSGGSIHTITFGETSSLFGFFGTSDGRVESLGFTFLTIC